MKEGLLLPSCNAMTFVCLHLHLARLSGLLVRYFTAKKRSRLRDHVGARQSVLDMDAYKVADGFFFYQPVGNREKKFGCITVVA